MTPDNLFRNKFENFQRPAPVGAWDKIEQNLGKRSKPVVVWMRVAAGIAVLTTAAFILWPSQKENQTLSETTKSTTPKEATQPVVVDSAKQEVPVLQKATENYTASRETKSIQKKQSNTTVPVQTPKVQEPVIVVPEPKDDQLIAEVKTSVQEYTIEPQKSETTITSTTITYSADEVESKFLKKKVMPQATSEPTDASTMQKLIGLAYAAKNSDADIGSLRQKKDEILALNFRNKKGEN